MAERWISENQIVETLDRVFGFDQTLPIPDDTAADREDICSLSDALDDYKILTLTIGKADDDGEDRCFERWLGRWGERDVRSIGSKDIYLYLTELTQKNFPLAEVEQERRFLAAFFNWAHRCALTTKNPAQNLPPIRERPKQITVAWSFVEQRKLLNACRRRRHGSLPTPEIWLPDAPPSYLYPLVLLGLQTGLRLGNLLHLEWRHVDLFADTIRIPATEVRTCQALEIRLPRESSELLLALWEGIQELDRKPERVFDALELPRQNCVPDDRSVLKEFRRACRRAKIRPGDFASLRLTFAHNCCRTGVPFDRASKIVDWDDVAFLIDIYQTESLKRSQERLKIFTEEVGRVHLPTTPIQVRRRGAGAGACARRKVRRPRRTVAMPAALESDRVHARSRVAARRPSATSPGTGLPPSARKHLAGATTLPYPTLERLRSSASGSLA